MSSTADNRATPTAGATHPAYYPYQPPPPSRPADHSSSSTTATPDNNQHRDDHAAAAAPRHHPTPPMPDHHHRPPTVSPTTSPIASRSPSPTPILPTPSANSHALRRNKLLPHEQLADDIPRPHNRPLPAYAVAPARGSRSDDVTDHIAAQAWASAANLPVGLGILEQAWFTVDNLARVGNGYAKSSSGGGGSSSESLFPVPLLRNPRNGDVVEGVLGQPLYDLPILGGLGGRISTQVEAWRVAMWLCYDGRVTLHDVSARMRVVRTKEQLKIVEDALAVRVVAWCREHAGLMFHCRSKRVSERDVRLVGGLGEEKVMRNVVWDVWRRVPCRAWAETDEEYQQRVEQEPMFVTQPRATDSGGDAGLGAMWPALEKHEGLFYGKRTVTAWVEWLNREKESLTGVPRQKKKDLPEEIPEGWLFGTYALRERPKPWDVKRMSGDPEWALKRWNVEPGYQPAPQSVTQIQSSANVGLGLSNTDLPNTAHQSQDQSSPRTAGESLWPNHPQRSAVGPVK